jgi:hypothetical protein
VPPRGVGEDPMAKVNLTVSIKDEHIPRFTELVDRIKKTGFEVDQELPSSGVVTGRIESEKIDDLKKLNEVAHVEESRSYQIPPPESDVQ